MDVNKTKSDQLHIDYDVFLYKANELNKYELSPLVAKLRNVIHCKKKKKSMGGKLLYHINLSE